MSFHILFLFSSHAELVYNFFASGMYMVEVVFHNFRNKGGTGNVKR